MYYYKQANDDGDNAISEERLVELDEEIKEKKNVKKQLEEECSEMKKEVDSLESEPNDDVSGCDFMCACLCMSGYSCISIHVFMREQCVSHMISWFVCEQ